MYGSLPDYCTLVEHPCTSGYAQCTKVLLFVDFSFESHLYMIKSHSRTVPTAAFLSKQYHCCCFISMSLERSFLYCYFCNAVSILERVRDGRTKLCSNCPGHMTNMTAMPKYVKKFKTSSSPEPKGLWPRNLVCSIGCINCYQLCSNDDPGFTLTYLTTRSNLVPHAFVLEKGKTMDISETIVVYDVKVGRGTKLNEYMNLYEYQWRSRSFTELGPRSFSLNILKLLCWETATPIKAKFQVDLS